MEINLSDFFDDCMPEYYSHLLTEARKANPDYADAENEEGECEQAVRELLLEKTNGVQKFVDAISHVSVLQWGILYEQGWRDCVALLKYLKIL